MNVSVRILFACFIVVSGIIALFDPALKEIALICLGAACGYIAPKPAVTS